ncbi:MAG TPA: HEAT repeat domain-containing protein [Kiritimatiellia bacterium]|nr:HEAT repeat domain-containing protein [Kiritimatiellia bacterium]
MATGLVALAALAGVDEDLLLDATRYGSTPSKRAVKEKARAELFSRGPDGLRLVMRHVHLENVGVQGFAFEMVQELGARAAPVLVEFLGDEQALTRQLAAWYLGFGDTPEYAAPVLELLSDEKACGAAMRTLGKWRVRAAVPAILPFTRHERETRRVVAINALRDIGDPAAIPALRDALNDPFFTVREAAARALASLGRPAEQALLRALPGAKGGVRRHMVRALGAMRSRRAAGALRKLFKAEDPFVREDAAEALDRIRGARPVP